MTATPIDYSDIPLFGEDWLSAQLLETVCRHCGTTDDKLDSDAIPAHADLIRLCSEDTALSKSPESVTGASLPRCCPKAASSSNGSGPTNNATASFHKSTFSRHAATGARRHVRGSLTTLARSP